MADRFVGKVVLITGGARGIGAVTARKFSEQGAKVAIADINIDAATELVDSLPNALAIKMDVTDRQQVKNGFQKVIDRFGGIDILFNNHGADDKPQELHLTDDANWHKMVAINGTGFFYVLAEGITRLLERGGGVVVNTSSKAALAGFKNTTPYTFAKAGVVGVTRSAALEYADRGIRINSVAPGATLTPLLEEYIAAHENPEEFRAEVEAMDPVPGFTMPEDIASAVLFLASEDAGRITGLTIPVDGGRHTVG